MLGDLLEAAAKEEILSDEAVEQFYTYAYAQYKCGRFSDAAEVFRVLCAKCPFEGRFWFGLAAANQEAELYEEAMSAWAMAALIDRENPYPHFHAAECALSVPSKMAHNDARLALKEAEARTEKGHPLAEKISALRKEL